jgi:hypothetical protein
MTVTEERSECLKLFKWLDKCKRGDRHRFEIIRIVLSNHEKLLAWVFKFDRPEMFADSDTIRRQMAAYSSGEQILLSLACDIWFGESLCPIGDLRRLDPQAYRNALWAIDAWRNS